jgi:hypothetical protein
MKEILAKSLLNKIERLEAFEERLSLRFENISIKIYANNAVSVYCEIHSNKGTTIEKTVKIECTAYDNDGQILDVKNTYVSKDNFFGFEILEFYFGDDEIADKINKLRLYPKL